jgi:cold shock CspA family protein
MYHRWYRFCSLTLLMDSHKRAGAEKPVYSGKPASGRIKELVRSQASGTISSPTGKVFFHKSDVDGEYWKLSVGDQVRFELLDDAISGPRAQHVRLKKPTGKK